MVFRIFFGIFKIYKTLHSAVKMNIFRICLLKVSDAAGPRRDTFGAKLAPQVLAAHRSPCAVLFSVHSILYPLSDWLELTHPAL